MLTLRKILNVSGAKVFFYVFVLKDVTCFKSFNKKQQRLRCTPSHLKYVKPGPKAKTSTYLCISRQKIRQVKRGSKLFEFKLSKIAKYERNNVQKNYTTRMHSRRMRTTRSLIVSPYLVVSHAHPPEQPCTPPPEQPCMPPPQSNHTCPPPQFAGSKN